MVTVAAAAGAVAKQRRAVEAVHTRYNDVTTPTEHVQEDGFTEIRTQQTSTEIQTLPHTSLQGKHTRGK